MYKSIEVLTEISLKSIRHTADHNQGGGSNIPLYLVFLVLQMGENDIYTQGIN